METTIDYCFIKQPRQFGEPHAALGSKDPSYPGLVGYSALQLFPNTALQSVVVAKWHVTSLLTPPPMLPEYPLHCESSLHVFSHHF